MKMRQSSAVSLKQERSVNVPGRRLGSTHESTLAEPTQNSPRMSKMRKNEDTRGTRRAGGLPDSNNGEPAACLQPSLRPETPVIVHG